MKSIRERLSGRERVNANTLQSLPRPGVSAAAAGKSRLRLLQSGIFIFFGVICLRLVQIQIIESQHFREIAQKQYQARIVLPATRGDLCDRNGSPMASNSVFASFAADPQIAADDAHAIARLFSRLFGKPSRLYLDKLESDSRFVWLERQVAISNLKKIDPRKLDGIVVRYEPKRLYHDQVAGQLIGCTDIDNNGLAGVELAFDKDLRGTDGYVVFQRDGLGRARPTADYPRVEPTDGLTICLTIDAKIQAIAEKELQHGVQVNNAERGIAVILQPRTGEVLAMAQYPDIDPNRFGKYQLQDQKLRAVTDLFEPGSVFKIVTASAALEHGLVAPEKKFFAENGTYTVSVGGKPRVIRDTHPEGWITFQEGMECSSNIVMAKVSDIIGSERLFRMARDYGFGIETNIELPGEVKGVLKKPVDWSGTTLNTIAFGYEVAVTPLQIAAAYAAVANGGVLMQPHIFQKETDASGKIVRASQPEVIRRVISESTARTLTNFFEGVVLRGTGKPAAIPGVRAAGKTGTSKKFSEGRYGQGNYTASFVGFFPVEDPRLVCLVMIDNPRGGSYYGGTVSAPVFKAIAEQVMSTSEMFVPEATPVNMNATVMASRDPRTPVNTPAAEPRAVTLSAGAAPAANGAGSSVPNLRGCSIRKAVDMLASMRLEPVVKGSGIVVGQNPEAGIAAKAGMKIVLTCQPRQFAILDGE